MTLVYIYLRIGLLWAFVWGLGQLVTCWPAYDPRPRPIPWREVFRPSWEIGTGMAYRFACWPKFAYRLLWGLRRFRYPA